MFTVLIIIAVFLVSRLLFVPTMLGAFKLKQVIHKMNQDKWNIYLSRLDVREYLQAVRLFFLIPIVLCSFVGYFLFRKRHSMKKSMWLAALTFFGNTGQVVYRLHAHRHELIDKIRKIKEVASKAKVSPGRYGK